MPTVCPLQLLACPACRHDVLRIERDLLVCAACAARYPVLAGVPWMFAAPDAAVAEWRARFGRNQRELEQERDAATRALEAASLSGPTRSRLRHWASAQTEQIALLGDVLTPVLGASTPASIDAYVALRTRLPAAQGLTTYSANLHRDWCWGDAENAAAAALVQPHIDRRGHTALVLGAGACRLAYDLHTTTDAAHTVALDINPLLLHAAARIVDGQTVSLYEFPLAPRNALDCAVRRELRAPQSVGSGFHLLLGDALTPPLRSGAFDVVITPWFLDIVEADAALLAQRVNTLLKPGGKWVNFGSLTFVRPEPIQRIGLDELLLSVEANGFTKPRWSEKEIPYLCSPASRHARHETVVTFGATKRASVTAPPAHEALPAWIVAGTTPVPLLPSFRHQTGSTRIHAFIMSLIDGRRSLADMALVLEQQRLMARDEATEALRVFLTTMYDESRRSKAL